MPASMPTPVTPLPLRAPAPALAGRLDAADQAVALKAVGRVFDAWALSQDAAAALVDAAPRSWARMKAPGWSGRLGQDQLLRISALIGLYKGLHLYFSDELADLWVTRPNTGPGFDGAAPLARMLAGGLPAILTTRNQVDALRGGV